MTNAFIHDRSVPVLLIALFLLFVLPAFNPVCAQSGRRAATEKNKNGEENPLVQVKTSEVLLSVTVRNQAGNLATTLSQRDFIIIEDGVRQEITSFNKREVPINIVLLLDASGSIFKEMKGIRESAVKFVQQLRPIDKVSIIQFADKVELIQDWTSSVSDLKHAINWRYRSGESTHLWDAVFLAAEEKLATVEGRKAIIILTDGVDSASKISREQAYWSTVKSGASVYVISKAEAIVSRLKNEYGGVGGRIAGTKKQVDQIAAQFDAAEASMRDFTVKTGGNLYSPLKDDALSEAYLAIAEELQGQYIITYTPTNDQRNGGFRGVKVALTQPGLTVNTREGYVAPRE